MCAERGLFRPAAALLTSHSSRCLARAAPRTVTAESWAGSTALLPPAVLPLSLPAASQAAVKGLLFRLSLWESFLLLFSCQEASFCLASSRRGPSASCVPQMSAGEVRGEEQLVQRGADIRHRAEIPLLAGGHVLKLVCTVIAFPPLPLLSAGDVSPQPPPCEPRGAALLLPSRLRSPREPAAVATLYRNS